MYSNGVLVHRILSSPRAAIFGLAINSEYRVRVIAFNDLGDGKEVTGVRTSPVGAPGTVGTCIYIQSMKVLHTLKQATDVALKTCNT